MSILPTYVQHGYIIINQRPWFTLGFTGGVRSMGLDKCIYHCRIIGNSWPNPLCSAYSFLPPPLGNYWSFFLFFNTVPQYIFFSRAHGTLSRIDHMWGHKTCLNAFKKTKSVSSIFSDHDDNKLDISDKKRTGKFTNLWKLNDMLPKN